MCKSKSGGDAHQNAVGHAGTLHTGNSAQPVTVKVVKLDMATDEHIQQIVRELGVLVHLAGLNSGHIGGLKGFVYEPHSHLLVATRLLDERASVQMRRAGGRLDYNAAVCSLLDSNR